MKRLIISALVSIVAAGHALAADLPQPAPPPPQAPAMYVPAAPIYNWAGIYVGINGGYAFGNSDWTGGAASSGSFSTSGGLVGGTLGVNFQSGQFVYGVETDLDYAPVKGHGPAAFCLNCQTQSSWIGTTRGRVGFAADRVLFFATAGGAYGNVEASAFNTTNSSTEFGWTAGAGVEAAFAENWTAKIEYLFVDLSHGSCSSACGAPLFATQSVSFTESMIRGGVNFKFNF